MNKELLSAGNPFVPDRGQSAAGDYAVDMWMIHKILSPCVKDAYEPNMCAEMFRVSSECDKRLRMAAEFRRPADLDRTHSPQLVAGHGMGLSIVCDEGLFRSQAGE